MWVISLKGGFYRVFHIWMGAFLLGQCFHTRVEAFIYEREATYLVVWGLIFGPGAHFWVEDLYSCGGLHIWVDDIMHGRGLISLGTDFVFEWRFGWRAPYLRVGSHIGVGSCFCGEFYICSGDLIMWVDIFLLGRMPLYLGGRVPSK